jgi:hypothetical protein
MSLRLRRRIRITAGWLVALAYFACVVSPGVALALGSRPAPCLSEEVWPVGLAPMQNESAAMPHIHADASSHDAGEQHAHHHAITTDDAAGHDQAAHHHNGHTLPGPCCAMMCVSAIPADLPAIALPSQPVSLCVLEMDRGAPDNAPPLLYRPPIA